MALRDQPYIPLYVQDIMTDEKLNECCAATHGIYIKGIMCLMHKSEEYGKILLRQKDKQEPNKLIEQNEKQVFYFACKIARHTPYNISEICNAITELLNEQVLYLDGDYLCQKRMINDHIISELRAEAGGLGGAKTAAKFAKANAKAKNQANSEYENDIENDIIINEPFEKFWNLYEKKIGKTKALNEWKKLKPEEMAAALKYIPSYKLNKEKQFRKDPERFLRNKCWNDELVSPEAKNNGEVKHTEYVGMKPSKFWNTEIPDTK